MPRASRQGWLFMQKPLWFPMDQILQGKVGFNNLSGAFSFPPARREWSILDLSSFEAMVKHRLLRCLLRTSCLAILFRKFKCQIDRYIAMHCRLATLWNVFSVFSSILVVYVLKNAWLNYWFFQDIPFLIIVFKVRTFGNLWMKLLKFFRLTFFAE